MRLAALHVALALSLVGCTCFEPVEERFAADAGRDGGHGRDGGAARDAGVDAGAGQDGGDPSTGCGAWCSLGDAGFLCFPDDTVPAFICLADKCVRACAGPRICNPSGTCLVCSSPPSNSCPPPNCAAATCSMTIERSNCAELEGAQWKAARDSTCRVVITGADGAVKGEWWELTSGELLGNFPALGGWCVGRQLPTGAPRIEWFCPRCQFVEMGCWF